MGDQAGRQARAWEDFRIGAVGSYIIDQSDLWKRFVPASERYTAALRADGGGADWWKLPKLGVTGNGQMMMDKNSDQVAGLVQRWITDKRLMQ